MVLSGPSQMYLSSNPGIGAEPDPKQSKKLTVGNVKLTA